MSAIGMTERLIDDHAGFPVTIGVLRNRFARKLPGRDGNVVPNFDGFVALNPEVIRETMVDMRKHRAAEIRIALMHGSFPRDRGGFIRASVC